MMEWENKLYQILLPGREALGVMEDWLECNNRNRHSSAQSQDTST